MKNEINHHCENYPFNVFPLPPPSQLKKNNNNNGNSRSRSSSSSTDKFKHKGKKNLLPPPKPYSLLFFQKF